MLEVCTGIQLKKANKKEKNIGKECRKNISEEDI